MADVSDDTKQAKKNRQRYREYVSAKNTVVVESIYIGEKTIQEILVEYLKERAAKNKML